jgi:diadenylate cyclase
VPPVPDVPAGISDVFARLDLSAVVDILIVSLSIYWMLLLVRGTTAMTVLRGVGVLLIAAFLLSRVLDLRMLNWILRNSVAGLVIGMIIIFQPEVRRALERLGRTGLRSALGRREYRDTLDLVVRGSQEMARQHIGALIVLERETGLEDVIDTGIRIDAHLTLELLLSMFTSTSPLHDGAIILRVDTILAGGCTLPLSQAELPAGQGTRHRAALGITETTDAVVVVVSEERGEVSLASNGRMVAALDESRLNRQLHRLFDLEYHEEPAEPAAHPRAAGSERRAS